MKRVDAQRGSASPEAEEWAQGGRSKEEEGSKGQESGGGQEEVEAEEE